MLLYTEKRNERKGHGQPPLQISEGSRRPECAADREHASNTSSKLPQWDKASTSVYVGKTQVNFATLKGPFSCQADTK
jgi:hypothetical protein